MLGAKHFSQIRSFKSQKAYNNEQGFPFLIHLDDIGHKNPNNTAATFDNGNGRFWGLPYSLSVHNRRPLYLRGFVSFRD